MYKYQKNNAIVKGFKVRMLCERINRIQQEQQVGLEKSTSGFGEQQVKKDNATGGKQENATIGKGNATSEKEIGPD